MVAITSTTQNAENIQEDEVPGELVQEILHEIIMDIQDSQVPTKQDESASVSKSKSQKTVTKLKRLKTVAISR